MLGDRPTLRGVSEYVEGDCASWEAIPILTILALQHKSTVSSWYSEIVVEPGPFDQVDRHSRLQKGRFDNVTNSTNDVSDRHAEILETAAKVFLRYGYKKTSMDDIARAAGLSRQGLYFHFKSKEELFRATILSIMDNTHIAYRDVLAKDELSLFERLLGAFEAFHGCSIGQIDEQYVGEILETAASLIGDAPAEHERRFISDVAEALDTVGVDLTYPTGIGPREVAETLCATSYGLKHRVDTPEEYRDRMSITLCIALGSDYRKLK